LGRIVPHMQPHEILAASSLSRGRMGIEGIVLFVLFCIGVTLTIGVIGRHEYCPSGYAIFGVRAISLMSAGIRGAIGEGNRAWLSALSSVGLPVSSRPVHFLSSAFLTASLLAALLQFSYICLGLQDEAGKISLSKTPSNEESQTISCVSHSPVMVSFSKRILTFTKIGVAGRSR